MEIRKNKIKAFFRQGKTTFGLWNGITNTYAAEICAGAGFDWICIDGEHAPFDLQSILANHQAMSGHDCGILVRPPVGDATVIKQLLDIGVQSLLIPMVDTAEQATDLVRAVTYPPKGKRGVGSALSRAAQWKRVPDYFEKVQDEICLIVQIETVKGMENIEAICQVEGVDGVFIGPADLAGSMGMLGQSMHDDVRTEVKRGLQIIKKSGKAAGVLAVRDDVIKEYQTAGASFIGIGVDLILLAKATENLAKKYK